MLRDPVETLQVLGCNTSIKLFEVRLAFLLFDSECYLIGVKYVRCTLSCGKSSWCWQTWTDAMIAPGTLRTDHFKNNDGSMSNNFGHIKYHLNYSGGTWSRFSRGVKITLYSKTRLPWPEKLTFEVCVKYNKYASCSNIFKHRAILIIYFCCTIEYT
jgi:hypothetical protein